MSNSLPLNPFLSVRPRAQDTAPSKAPRKTNHSKAPKSGNVHLLLDSNGRQTVSLERRTKGAIVIGTASRGWPTRPSWLALWVGCADELASLRSRKACVGCCKPWRYA